MLKLILTLCLPIALLAAEMPALPIDPVRYKELTDAMVESARNKDDRAVIRDGRKALEIFPNNPELQAPIYALMAQAYAGLGESDRGADYSILALLLSPDSAPSTPKSDVRGDASSTIQTAVSAFAQSMNAVQQIQLMRLCLDMVKHNMTPPPQCTGQAGAQGASVPPPIAPMPVIPTALNAASIVPAPMPPVPGDPNGMQPPLAPPPLASLPLAGPTAAIAYPSAPVGTPAYQAPVPASVPTAPWPSQPSPSPSAPIAYPSAPVGSPGYQAPPQATAPTWPQQQVPAQAQQRQQHQSSPMPSTQGAGRPSYGRASAAAPYQNANYSPRTGRNRGGDVPVFRVMIDRSSIQATNYFEPACGALLSVSGENLTLTTACGEAPSVIPASDVLDIRLNSLIGREMGAFHISTKQGFYVSMAPESRGREDSRALIESIRKQLTLPE